jgi:hypothetical protein
METIKLQNIFALYKNILKKEKLSTERPQLHKFQHNSSFQNTMLRVFSYNSCYRKKNPQIHIMPKRRQIVRTVIIKRYR